MFRWITIISLCGAAGLAVLHWLLFPCGCGERLSVRGVVRRKVHLLTLLFLPARLNLLGRIRKLMYLVAIFAFLVLAATGFWPVMAGVPIAGWLLMIHVTFGGVFAFCFAFLALTWAQKFVFGGQKMFSCPAEDFIAKASFWAMVLLSLPVILSMVLSMFPLLGSEWQEILLWIHRYSTLGFAIAAIIGTYFVLRKEILKDADCEK